MYVCRTNTAHINANGSLIKAQCSGCLHLIHSHCEWSKTKMATELSLYTNSHTLYTALNTVLSNVMMTTKKPSWVSIFPFKTHFIGTITNFCLPLQYHPLDQSMIIWIVSMGFFVFPLSVINSIIRYFFFDSYFWQKERKIRMKCI